ncbi:spore coat U domain-containing protein [Utexia brackfieldae]|uniref:Csu type fimbrial protein n=1 Tax=Utexia brackfieldae TaxID=3074108 RepID=UPI00370DDB4C
MKNKLSINKSNLVKSVLLGSTFLLAAQSAQADSVSGTIGVTITLTSSCVINGAAPGADLTYGTINFGTRTTFFNSVDSSLQPTGGGNTTIQCTPGTTASAKLVSGANDTNQIAPRKHVMANGTKYVPYDLYKEAARTTVINNGDTVFTGTADGTPQTFNLYARAFGTDGLTAGTYNDTLTVELTF